MTDFDELKLMASKPEFAYDVDSYDMLKYIRYLLAYKACEGTSNEKIYTIST
jgi:hypothetical protein